MESRIIGVDIGGTKISVSVGTTNAQIIDKVIFATKFCLEETLNTLKEIILNFTSKYSSIIGVGVSCGGPLNSELGVIVSPPNLPNWRDVPICSLISSWVHLPTFLENDASACALAEWKWGAGIGIANLVFLTFGTGMGAGLILNNTLYRGTSGLAGEVGHIRLHENGPIGYGKKGSFEGFCSGGGLSRNYENHFSEYKSGKQICEDARSGSIQALEIINESARYLGYGLSIILDILNPEMIIIGSIYTRDMDLFNEEMMRVIEKEALPESKKNCLIVPSVLKENLGDLAAIGTFLNRYEAKDI